MSDNINVENWNDDNNKNCNKNNSNDKHQIKVLMEFGKWCVKSHFWQYHSFFNCGGAGKLQRKKKIIRNKNIDYIIEVHKIHTILVMQNKWNILIQQCIKKRKWKRKRKNKIRKQANRASVNKTSKNESCKREVRSTTSKGKNAWWFKEKSINEVTT